MFKVIKVLTLTLTMMMFGVAQQAHAEAPIYTSVFNNKALKGYDTVSYFLGTGQPVKGSEKFKTEWRGADWYFATQDNLDAFKGSPEKYAPQYGGYCAWAVAKGNLVKSDPQVYTLLHDKLYLNFNKKVNNKWLPHKEDLIEKADRQFSGLVDLE